MDGQEAHQQGARQATLEQTLLVVISVLCLTIAGACLCLTATRLPYFQTMGLPCAIALLVIVFAALTLAPAVLVIGSRFGLFDPKRELSTRGWRTAAPSSPNARRQPQRDARRTSTS